jgi:hypothetical protein
MVVDYFCDLHDEISCLLRSIFIWVRFENEAKLWREKNGTKSTQSYEDYTGEDTQDNICSQNNT